MLKKYRNHKIQIAGVGVGAPLNQFAQGGNRTDAARLLNNRALSMAFLRSRAHMAKKNSDRRGSCTHTHYTPSLTRGSLATFPITIPAAVVTMDEGGRDRRREGRRGGSFRSGPTSRTRRTTSTASSCATFCRGHRLLLSQIRGHSDAADDPRREQR